MSHLLTKIKQRCRQSFEGITWVPELKNLKFALSKRDKLVPEPQSGEIHVYHGPMFSGKTTAIREHFYRIVEAGREAVVVNHPGSNRHYMADDVLSTHWCNLTNEGMPVQYSDERVTIHTASALTNLVSSTPVGNAVFFIDEGHFFEDLTQSVENLAKKGHDVYIAMLKCNSEL